MEEHFLTTFWFLIGWMFFKGRKEGRKEGRKGKQFERKKGTT